MGKIFDCTESSNRVSTNGGTVMGKAKRFLAGILAAVVAFSSDGIVMAANSRISEPRNDLISADGIYFYTIDEDNLSITGYQGTGNELIIPNTIDGYKVIAIKRGAFAGHSELTSIMLPESLMSIGPGSFSGTSIRTITIPKNVNRNGEDGYVSTSGSLNGATDLTEVIFQDGITKIPDYICASCNNVTKIVISSSVTEICLCKLWRAD